MLLAHNSYVVKVYTLLTFVPVKFVFVIFLKILRLRHSLNYSKIFVNSLIINLVVGF